MGGNHRVSARARHFHLGRLICYASLSLAVLATTGCAVSQDAKNGTRFALDAAALLGTELAHFTLTDNSNGTFRKLGDAYSLKLEKFHKVIALGNARQARLDRGFHIDGRTVLVIHMQTNDGCFKTQLLSIRDAQALQWQVTPSDCKSIPTVTLNKDQLVLSYSGSRFVYAGGQLAEEKITEQATTRTPSRPAPATPAAQEPRVARKAPPRPTPSATAAMSTTPAAPASTPAQAARPSAPTAVPELRFSRSMQEQKPTVITLE